MYIYSTGILEAVSAAVGLKPPVYCYPVSDLDSEAPGDMIMYYISGSFMSF
jgi:hypothetical protein